jgi:hypothetical protein
MNPVRTGARSVFTSVVIVYGTVDRKPRAASTRIRPKLWAVASEMVIGRPERSRASRRARHAAHSPV